MITHMQATLVMKLFGLLLDFSHVDPLIPSQMEGNCIAQTVKERLLANLPNGEQADDVVARDGGAVI